MTLPRFAHLDRWARRDEGAYVVITETDGQAPIVMETEGADTSLASCMERVNRMRGGAFGGPQRRWCIARLVPVEGNELLVLDLERLQEFTNKKEGDE